MVDWSASDAKRRFAQVLRQADSEPQLITLRGKPVAVVMSHGSYARNRKAFAQKALAQWIEELRPLHEVEGDMEVPRRDDRPDAVGDDLE